MSEGILAKLYSTLNSADRKRRDLVNNPKGVLQMLADQLANATSYRAPVASKGELSNRPMTDREQFDDTLNLVMNAGPNIIKPVGGQWLTTGGNTPRVATSELHTSFPREISDVDRARNEALNNWIDTTLHKYVKERMGSPLDELRGLIEKGRGHIDTVKDYVPDNMGVGAAGVYRDMSDFPYKTASDFGPVRNAEAVKNWEDIVDSNIVPQKARTAKQSIIIGRRREHPEAYYDDLPWLNKTPDDTTVYELRNRDYLGNDTGLNNLTATIHNRLRDGRLSENNLNKVSVKDAAEMTYEDRMAKLLAEEKARLEEQHIVHKDYGDGFKWVKLDKPGQFDRESDAMGHSVRGYEPWKGHPDNIEGQGLEGYEGYGLGGWPAIKEGRAEIYSLRDSKNRPHATVEVKRGRAIDPSLTEDQIRDQMAEGEEMNPEAFEEFVQKAIRANKTPDTINQIKGKQNTKIGDLYQPYVQDFIKSGNWDKVNDVENAGMIHYGPDFHGSFVDTDPSKIGYYTPNELQSVLKEQGFDDEYIDAVLRQSQDTFNY